MANQFTIVVKFNGKSIGTLCGRKLIKTGKQVVLMRLMDGFGMPKYVIDSITADAQVALSQWSSKLRRNIAVLHNFDTIEIHYENTIYQVSVQTFQAKGIVYERPPYEAQYILPRKYFVAIDPQQLTLI